MATSSSTIASSIKNFGKAVFDFMVEGAETNGLNYETEKTDGSSGKIEQTDAMTSLKDKLQDEIMRDDGRKSPSKGELNSSDDFYHESEISDGDNDS